ncbi:MAG: capsule polysaccharide modification protein [Neisseriaceae bacterium]|nr:capsule polysaccharide modification protein [Neisseriaceae bacterium]
MVQVKHNLEVLLDTSQNILLLQGPMSGFFLQFSKWLSKYRKTVYKINFNGGDEYYYPESNPNTFAFTDRMDNFGNFLSDFIEKNNIDSIVCFGDTRPMHKMAKQVSLEKNLHFWAMEEGYFRPFFITIEKDGCNYFSPIPLNAAFFQAAFDNLKEKEYQLPKGYFKPFWGGRLKGLFYTWYGNQKRSKYLYYRHHRDYKMLETIRPWLTGFLRRLKYRGKDKSLMRKIIHNKISNFYILPLQLFDDAQISVHSDFASVEDFLLQMLQSFANYAPPDLNLMVKHHPFDIYFKDYTKQINDFIKKNPHCKGRVFYIHDMPMPVLLRKGRAMVVLNSTSGVSALVHHLPVKAMGRANYNIAGLTDQNSLADFWKNPKKPDAELFNAFRQYHMNVTQVVGNFYSKVLLPDFPQDEHNE